jgi:hypothetical protein
VVPLPVAPPGALGGKRGGGAKPLLMLLMSLPLDDCIRFLVLKIGVLAGNCWLPGCGGGAGG